MRKKIAEKKPLTWYEEEATIAYREAFAKGEASETLQQHFRNNQHPKVVADMRVRGAWQTASGVRGNSTPAAKDRSSMRNEYKKAITKYTHIKGSTFLGAEDRFQSSVGRESNIGIPCSRSMIASGRDLKWCQEADRHAKQWEEQQENEAIRVAPKAMTPAARAKKWSAAVDIKVA